jgi:hypothetical protein
VNFSLPLRTGGTIGDVAATLSATSPQKTFFIDCPAPELAGAVSPQVYNLPWPWTVGVQIVGATVSLAGSTSLSPANVTVIAIEPVSYTTSILAMRAATTAGLPAGLPVGGGFSGLLSSARNTLSSMVSINEPFTVTAPAFVIHVDCSYPIGPRNVTCGPGFYGTRFNFSCPVLREEAYCTWWDANASAFSSVGCTAVPSSAAGGGRSAIDCSCDHLTEFAARFAALAAEQKSIFAAAESLGDPRTLQRYPHVPILIAVLFVALGAVFILGSRADARGARVFAQSLAADPEVRSLAALEAAHGRVFILDARLPKEVVDEWLAAAPLRSTSGDIVAEADVGAHELSAFGNASGKAPNLHTASIYLRLAALFEPQRADLKKDGVSVLEKAGVNKTTLATIVAHMSRAPPPPPPQPPSPVTTTLTLLPTTPSTPLPTTTISSAQTATLSTTARPMESARRMIKTTSTAASDAATKAASAVSTAITNARSMSLTFDMVGGTSCARAVRLRGLLVRLFILRLFYSHAWLSILWKFDEKSPRVLRVAALTAAISLTMFSTAFLYAFSGGSPGADLPALTFVEAYFVGLLASLIELPAAFVLGILYSAAAEEHFALTYPALAEDLRRRQLAELMLDRATRAELEAECGDALAVTNVADGDDEDDKAHENKAAGWYEVPTLCVRIAPGTLRTCGRHPDQRAAFVAQARLTALEAAARARVRIAAYSGEERSSATRSHVVHAEDELAFALETSSKVSILSKPGCFRAARHCSRQKVVVSSEVTGSVQSARSSAGSMECGGAATRTAWLSVTAVTGGCLFYVVLFGMTQPAGATASFVTAFFMSQLFSSLVIAPCTLAAILVYELAVAPAWNMWWWGGKSSKNDKAASKTSLSGRLKHLTLVRAAGAASLLAPDEAMAALSEPKSVAAACSVNTKATAAGQNSNARDALVFRRFLVAQARSAEFARARRAEEVKVTAAASGAAQGTGDDVGGATGPRRPGDGGDGSESLPTQRLPTKKSAFDANIYNDVTDDTNASSTCSGAAAPRRPGDGGTGGGPEPSPATTSVALLLPLVESPPPLSSHSSFLLWIRAPAVSPTRGTSLNSRHRVRPATTESRIAAEQRSSSVPISMSSSSSKSPTSNMQPAHSSKSSPPSHFKASPFDSAASQNSQQQTSTASRSSTGQVERGSASATSPQPVLVVAPPHFRRGRGGTSSSPLGDSNDSAARRKTTLPRRAAHFLALHGGGGTSSLSITPLSLHSFSMPPSSTSARSASVSPRPPPSSST